MKTVNRMALIMGAGMAMLLFAGNVSAQDKPKGLPWDASAANASVKSPVKSDAAGIAEGKTIYNQNCKSCHGVKGLGDGEKSKKIDISCGNFTAAEFLKESEGAIYWKITEGRKPMPSFSEKLTDTERWKVVLYIRSMKNEK
ncbi:MAG TPA: c-type cytochrome [Bacteroidia bacterium]|jgi:mono/diheme cytochrome c family protein|nr:c-type cytochrome [Bacteroidia bacterium]